MKLKHSNKLRDILQLAIALGILILVNFIGSLAFERFDLTTEKRYSLTEASKDLVRELDDIIFIRVYLEGDLPAGFRRLQDETKQILDEFRAYSNGNIEYEFINPSAEPDEKTRNEVYQNLVEQGLQWTDLNVRTEDGSSNKIIWPGAIFSYRDRETPVQILKSRMGMGHEAMLNNSIQQLEYEIASTISKLTKETGGRIAFIEGHGELDAMQVADITKSLKEQYNVQRVEIANNLDALDGYQAIIIAKPDSMFNDGDKFIIDQFIMKGGKALWLLDAVQASMDSLQNNNTSMGLAISTNLEDQLF